MAKHMERHIKVMLTGATGMVGEGVLLTCLRHPQVASVLVLGRRPCGVSHPRLTELLVGNFAELGREQPLPPGYDACFFCAGVSSIGRDEATFTRLTYDLALQVAQPLAATDPDMVFCYVSGLGTDGTEKGRRMWARVKGRTENTLMKLFPHAYMFRPGFMAFYRGQRRVPWLLRGLGRIYPILSAIFPAYVGRVEDVGLAMIAVTLRGAAKRVLEVADIRALAADEKAVAQ